MIAQYSTWRGCNLVVYRSIIVTRLLILLWCLFVVVASGSFASWPAVWFAPRSRPRSIWGLESPIVPCLSQSGPVSWSAGRRISSATAVVCGGTNSREGSAFRAVSPAAAARPWRRPSQRVRETLAAASWRVFAPRIRSAKRSIPKRESPDRPRSSGPPSRGTPVSRPVSLFEQR